MPRTDWRAAVAALPRIAPLCPALICALALATAANAAEPPPPPSPPAPRQGDRAARGGSPPAGRGAGDGAPDSPPRHIGARIVSIQNFPDAIVVHLDNNQVWEQIQEASADANLHAGDAVSID